jgi:hypothetical protein
MSKPGDVTAWITIHCSIINLRWLAASASSIVSVPTIFSAKLQRGQNCQLNQENMVSSFARRKISGWIHIGGMTSILKCVNYAVQVMFPVFW